MMLCTNYFHLARWGWEADEVWLRGRNMLHGEAYGVTKWVGAHLLFQVHSDGTPLTSQQVYGW